MANHKLVVGPLLAEEYAEAAEVYLNSRHFLVELSGEDPESIGLELVFKEAAQARAHEAVFAGIRLVENRQMVGIATYQPSGYKGQPSQAWIALLMVAEKYQSLGYGAESYRIVEETIFSKPEVQKVKLGVLTNNPRGLEFWRKMGYRDTGIRKPGDAGRELVIMEKSRIPAGG